MALWLPLLAACRSKAPSVENVFDSSVRLDTADSGPSDSGSDDSGADSTGHDSCDSTDSGVDSSDSGADSGAEDGFVRVPAGTFEMGCTDGMDECKNNIEVEHSVTLTHDLLLSPTEVTQDEFQALAGYNPASFTTCGDGASCPVDTVSWNEAAAYANAVSDGAGRQECYTCTGTGSAVLCDVAVDPYLCDGYRLPTEAEWEWAARCGGDLPYSGSADPDDVGWTPNNSDAQTHAGGLLAASACGTFDMTGNVFEWTQDWFEDYAGDAVDPTGPTSGTARVSRGGSWLTMGNVAARRAAGAGYADAQIGLRLARTAD